MPGIFQTAFCGWHRRGWIGEIVPLPFSKPDGDIASVVSLLALRRGGRT
jgi:hypothetical protein